MKAPFTKRLRSLSALQFLPFRLLWLGQTVSSLGNGAHYVALAWQILLLTNSGVSIGIVLTISTISSILFLLIGGGIADMLPQRLVLLWSDAGRAFFVLCIAVLSLLHLLQIWHLIVAEVFFGLANGFFLPAYQAITPQIVETEELASANTLNSFSKEFGLLVGPLVGAWLIVLAGPAGAFALDGLSFVVSAWFLFMMKYTTQPEVAMSTQGASFEQSQVLTTSISQQAKNGMKKLFKDVGEGLGYVVGSTWLWVTIGVTALVNIGFSGSTQVALPILVHNVYKSDAWLLGMLGSAAGLGSLAGALLVGQTLHLFKRRGLLAYLLLLASGLGLIFIGLPLPHLAGLVVINVATALIGICLGAYSVIWVTLLQEFVAKDLLGRVSSVDWLGTLSLTPVGYALAGWLTDWVGPGWVYIFSGLLFSGLVLVALIGTPQIRRMR